MSLWKLGSCQCFATPEVSASFGDHETIDISFDIGSLSEKILTDLITTSDQIPICFEDKKYCIAPLETCVHTDSLIEPDKLDAYSDFYGEKIAVDFTYSNGHCHFTQATARVEKTSTCKSYVAKLAALIGVSENLTLGNSANVRLMVAENELVTEDLAANLEKLVICDFTPRMLARSILDTQLLIELTDSQTVMDGIFALVGQKDTATLLSVFLGRPFHPGDTTQSENKRLLEYVKSMFQHRKKRGTFLEYIFSNGEQVDKISNKLVQLGSTLNSNMGKISENELNLQLSEQMNAKNIQVLDKRVNYNIKTEAALFLNQRKIDSTTLQSEMYISATINEIIGLLKVKNGLVEFGNLIINTMQRQQSEKCLQIEGRYKCIDFQRSNIIMKKEVIQLALYATVPKVIESNFISCLPIMSSKEVSTLHNERLVKIEKDLVGNGKVINIESLSDAKTTNAKVKKIEEKDVTLGIFITTSQNHVILSCFEPELVMHNGRQHNCTKEPLYLEKGPKFTIMTGKGVIEEGHIMSYKLDSKNTYLQEAKNLLAIQTDVFRFKPPSNITGLGMVLERLSQFSTPAIVGMSVGAGSILILGFCVIGCCSWLCGVKNCPASNRESFTRTPQPSSTSTSPSPPLSRAARPPHRNQPPVTVNTGPLISPDSEQVADQTLDYIREKVRSLSALRRM